MFFDNLYKLCKQKNTTPNGMAKILNISSGSVTSWKNGTLPKSDTLQKIASYFNVSTDYLLGNEPKEKSLSEKDRLIADIVNVLYSKTDDELIALRDMLVKFAQSKGK